MKMVGFPWGGTKWNDLDGQELLFKSDARPRAQYLYYHYCVAMLRRAWQQGKHGNILHDELGRKF